MTWEHSLIGRMEGLVELAATVQALQAPESLRQLLLVPVSVAMLATASDQGFKFLDWVPYEGGNDLPLGENQTLIWDKFKSELKLLAGALNKCFFTGKMPRRGIYQVDTAPNAAHYREAQLAMIDMIPTICWSAVDLEASALQLDAPQTVVTGASDANSSHSFQPDSAVDLLEPEPQSPRPRERAPGQSVLSYHSMSTLLYERVSQAMEALPAGTHYLLDVERILCLEMLATLPLDIMENQLHYIISELHPSADDLNETFSKLIDAQFHKINIPFSLTRSLLSFFAANSNVKPYIVLGADGNHRLTDIVVSNSDALLQKFKNHIAVPFAGEQAQLFTHQMISWSHKFLYALLEEQLVYHNATLAPETKNFIKVIEMLNMTMPPNWLADFVDTIMDRRGHKRHPIQKFFLQVISPDSAQFPPARRQILEDVQSMVRNYMLNDVRHSLSSIAPENADLCFVPIQNIVAKIEDESLDLRDLFIMIRVIEKHVSQWVTLSSSERLAASLHCLGVYHHLTLSDSTKCWQLYQHAQAAISKEFSNYLCTAVTILDPIQGAADKLQAYLKASPPGTSRVNDALPSCTKKMSGPSKLDGVLLQIAHSLKHWHNALTKMLHEPKNSAAAHQEREWFNDLKLTINNSHLLSGCHRPDIISGAIKDIKTMLAMRDKFDELHSEAVEDLLCPFRALAADAQFLIATSTVMQRWGAMSALRSLCQRGDANENMGASSSLSDSQGIESMAHQVASLPDMAWTPDSLARCPYSKTFIALMIVTKAQEEVQRLSHLQDALAYSSWIRQLLFKLYHGEALTSLANQLLFTTSTPNQTAEEAGALRSGVIAPLKIPTILDSLLLGTTTTRIKHLFAQAFDHRHAEKQVISHHEGTWMGACALEYFTMSTMHQEVYKAGVLAGAPWYVKHSKAAVLARILAGQITPPGEFAENSLKLLADIVNVLRERDRTGKNPLVMLLEAQQPIHPALKSKTH